MRGFVVVLTLFGLRAGIPAQSIEPEPGVVEQGGTVEIRAWGVDDEPLTALEIGLRRLHDDGSPDGALSGTCTTDQRGLAKLQVDGPPGRYRMEAEVGGVEVQSPFRVVPTAPRLAWFVGGVVAVAIAAGLIVGIRRRARAPHGTPAA